MQLHRNKVILELQQKIDEFQQQLNTIIEKGTKHLETNEERRDRIQNRIDALTAELEQQRDEYVGAVNESKLW